MRDCSQPSTDDKALSYWLVMSSLCMLLFQHTFLLMFGQAETDLEEFPCLKRKQQRKIIELVHPVASVYVAL